MLGLGPDALPELLRAAELMGFAGLNITHPLKQSVIPLLSELSQDARALGAVNTVLLRDGRRIGHNTDWSGFAASFRRGLPGARIDRLVLLGAGAAGAQAILTLGAGVLRVFDSDRARARQLARDLCGRFGAGRAVAIDDLEASMADAQGLIHATPTGTANHPGLPLPVEWLHRDLWVAEIVYFPLETALLQAARPLGCRTLDCGGMALFQAVEAFRLFTGATPDTQRMIDHFAAMSSTRRILSDPRPMTANTTTSTISPLAGRRTRPRLVVLALLATGTMINYLDRTVLGIAAPSLTRELGLLAAVVGLVFSAFSWTYAFAQIPGGVFLDRFGARLTYFLSVKPVVGFHDATRLRDRPVLAPDVSLRAGTGGGTLLSDQEPRRDHVVPGARAGACHRGLYRRGVPRSRVLQSGAVLAHGRLWLARALHRHRRRGTDVRVRMVDEVSGTTREHDGEPGRARLHRARRRTRASIDSSSTGFSWARVRAVLRFRQIWEACLGQFGGNSTLLFFLTWFPTYLATERQMGWIKIGCFAVMPFLAAAMGVMLGGWLSDALLQKTGSANVARKLPIIAGLLGASTIILANQVDSDMAAIAILSAAFFAQGMTGLGTHLGHRAQEPDGAYRRRLQFRCQPRGHHHAGRHQASSWARPDNSTMRSHMSARLPSWALLRTSSSSAT